MKVWLIYVNKIIIYDCFLIMWVLVSIREESDYWFVLINICCEKDYFDYLVWFIRWYYLYEFCY